MTTPTIEQIHQHYSVRAYKSEAVPAATVEAIVAAGQRASTSSNLQTFSVVAVTDEDKRRRLSELCGGQKQIVQAPVFLAWCADLARMERTCELRGYEHESGWVENFMVAAVDAALAMQNAALAAESMGLGMCYIGAIRNQPDKAISLLELPHLVFPISGMTLGWPAAEPFIRPRLPLKAILHWEKYETEGQDLALAEYDQTMIETDIYQGRQVPVPGQEGEMEDYGWLEHTARRASKAVRTDLRKQLATQGFDLK